MKRIGILHYSGPPVIGGVESVLQAQANLFLDHGYKVKVMVGKGKSSFCKKISSPSLIIMPEIASLPCPQEAFRDEKEFLRTRKIIEEKLRKEFSRIDCCIIHNVLTMPFNIALTAALHNLIPQNPRVKFIAWCHDSIFFDPAYKSFISSVDVHAYPWNLLKKSIRKVRYVAVSRHRAKQFSSLLKLKKVMHIPNGIDPQRFLKLGKRIIPIFDRLGIWEALNLLLPARIVPRKNLEMAVKICAEINRQGRDCCLLITSPLDPHQVQSQKRLSRLKELAKISKIENKIIFLGEIEDPIKKGPLKVGDKLLRDLYLLTDALLLPSKKEGFGIPMLEAGLTRLPIFYSGIPPLKEIGQKLPHYFSLKEGPGSIALKIIDFFNKNQRYHFFKRVLNQYRWQNIFKKKIEPLIKD